MPMVWIVKERKRTPKTDLSSNQRYPYLFKVVSGMIVAYALFVLCCLWMVRMGDVAPMSVADLVDNPMVYSRAYALRVGGAWALGIGTWAMCVALILFVISFFVGRYRKRADTFVVFEEDEGSDK